MTAYGISSVSVVLLTKHDFTQTLQDVPLISEFPEYSCWQYECACVYICALKNILPIIWQVYNQYMMDPDILEVVLMFLWLSEFMFERPLLKRKYIVSSQFEPPFSSFFSMFDNYYARS